MIVWHTLYPDHARRMRMVRFAALAWFDRPGQLFTLQRGSQ
jgi:hypothetical protein